MTVQARLAAQLSDRYAIEREIGAGGMATVYLARDLKHDRNVALKVLLPELGAVLGAERFEAEIKVTANLQHPNLLPLFDSGEADGLLFYVMPYVEGESLRARLDREKQLPLDDAIRIATAVASALDYAHRHEVIHRDLKPENILLHEGQPLIADFGIALAVSKAGGNRITQTGLSLGTPQYMSPEQATGDRSIDGRTDIYSLGAVTYEMLTGEPPHVGPTSQAVIAKVITDRPRSIRLSRDTVPAQVEAAVERALAKLPADRWASAHEFANAIANSGAAFVATGASSAAAAAPATQRTRRMLRRAALVGAAALWVATLVPAVRYMQKSDELPEVRFAVPAPSGAWAQIAVSPDGRNIVWVGDAPGTTAMALWVRPLGSTVAQRLPGTDGARNPFWSPDSRQIGFFAEGRLRRVDIAGGPPQSICNILDFNGGAWNRDGVIVFASGGALKRVLAVGGTPTDLITPGPDDHQASPRHPTFLPDGQRFLYLAWGNTAEKRAVYAASLDGGLPTRVLVVESMARFALPGVLLFNREGTAYAQTFDSDRFRLTGEPVRVASDVYINPNNGIAAFGVSDNGVLIYRSGAGRQVSTVLRWSSRTGDSLGVVGTPGRYDQMNLSPDNQRVAVQRVDLATGRPDIWTMEVSSGILTRLTRDSVGAAEPGWFADSRTVYFFSRRHGAINFYKQVVGSGEEQVVYESAESPKFLEHVSSDGRHLLILEPAGLVAMPTAGEAKQIRLLLKEGYLVDEARFSPDNRWISYGSNESGAWEVHVAAFPKFDQRRQVSVRGGMQARWRADGKELFFLTPDGKVMAAAVAKTVPLEFALPTHLFQSPLSGPSNGADQFAVSRDGRRFLFLVPQQQTSGADPITVVVNWKPPGGK